MRRMAYKEKKSAIVNNISSKKASISVITKTHELMRRMAYKEKKSAIFGKLFREFTTRSQK